MNIPPIPPIQLTDANREAAQQAVRQIANRLTAAAQELADAFAGTTKALRRAGSCPAVRRPARLPRRVGGGQIMTMTRGEIIAAAIEIHDREGCGCDRKYLMSCSRMVAAILRAPSEVATKAEGNQADAIDAHPWQEYNEHGNTCHYPGCRMTEEEHARLERPALRPNSATATSRHQATDPYP